MTIEEAVALTHRPRNVLPNKPLELTEGLRRRAARAIIRSARG